jgi:hypothetical protein
MEFHPKVGSSHVRYSTWPWIGHLVPHRDLQVFQERLTALAYCSTNPHRDLYQEHTAKQRENFRSTGLLHFLLLGSSSHVPLTLQQDAFCFDSGRSAVHNVHKLGAFAC